MKTVSRMHRAPALQSLPDTDFATHYLALRRSEGRICTDEEAYRLPYTASDHPLAAEWKVRARSCHRLIRYLKAKGRPLHILEVGCGNGWLARRMAEIEDSFVTATDINETELLQGTRVFRTWTNLRFEAGGLEKLSTDKRYDIIVFAASLQYFPSVLLVLNRAAGLLRAGGEIHILDTPFYEAEERKAARKRTADYFKSRGREAMTNYYFHHTMKPWEGFQSRLLSDPRSLWNRYWLRHPFPWICLQTR